MSAINTALANFDYGEYKAAGGKHDFDTWLDRYRDNYTLIESETVSTATIAETVDDLRAHVAAVVDLVEGYWVESPPDGDVLVCPDRYPDGEHRKIDLGDGPMLSEVVRVALADAIRRRMEGES